MPSAQSVQPGEWLVRVKPGGRSNGRPRASNAAHSKASPETRRRAPRPLRLDIANVPAGGVRPCAYCKRPTPEKQLVELEIAGMFTKLCPDCAEPVWGAMRLFNWVRKKLAK